MEKMLKMLALDEYHRPTVCMECNGIMVYKGVGEYRCEDCNTSDYDDYGKVRNYLEKHRGANVSEVSDATGVSHRIIREMIKEKRFEVIDNRGNYICCEMCGVNIKSGRLCEKCEISYHRQLEEQVRAERKAPIMGGDAKQFGEKGSKRFTRER